MKKNLANELKKLDIEIGKKMFSISKEKNMPSPPSPLQARIMDYLIINQEKAIYQKDLEKDLNISKSAISSTLVKMENNNIIERITSKDDARNKKILLKKDSIRIYENMKTLFEKLNEELTKNIPEKEIEDFYNVIEKLRKNIQ